MGATTTAETAVTTATNSKLLYYVPLSLSAAAKMCTAIPVKGKVKLQSNMLWVGWGALKVLPASYSSKIEGNCQGGDRQRHVCAYCYMWRGGF